MTDKYSFQWIPRAQLDIPDMAGQVDHISCKTTIKQELNWLNRDFLYSLSNVGFSIWKADVQIE